MLVSKRMRLLEGWCTLWILIAITFLVNGVNSSTDTDSNNGLLWRALRVDREEAEVCVNEYDILDSPYWDTCHEGGRGFFLHESNMTVQHIQQAPCFCDSSCSTYGDCCMDVSQDSAEQVVSWTCRDLPGSGIFVYTFQKCSNDWPEDDVKTRCEEEAESLEHQGKEFNYLQAIPVYSTESGVLYRNIYCAVCNYDTQVAKWQADIGCMEIRGTNRFNISNMAQLLQANATFDPRRHAWHVRTPQIKASCLVSIKEFSQWKDFIQLYHARLCRKAISSCSRQWDSDINKFKCSAYTSYIYETTGMFRSVVYKNFHCAMCNGAKRQALSCIPQHLLPTFSTDPSRFVWYPLLLDFNFVEDSGDFVGSFSNCALQNGKLYDPVLKKCLQLTCGKQLQLKGNKCVPLSNNLSNSTLTSYCTKVILEYTEFTVLGNDSIYVNHSNQIYHKDEYEVYKETNGTLMKILVCADEKLFFQFSAPQTWLSEITLFISIICLIFHLIVYTSLPQLQNLPGKILMSLAISLLVAHLSFLIAAYLTSINWLCRLFAIITHYSFLAAFFWMNVMAIDIFRTFRSSRLRSLHQKSTFLKYSLYAWASPASVVILALLIDQCFQFSSFSPRYGDGICWITRKRALLLFFAIPLALLLHVNAIFFIQTVRVIRQTARQTKIVSKFSEKVRFFLYMKLVVVFGLTWLFGFLASLLRVLAFWYPFIIFNGLQGALIFFAFTVKRKVLLMIREKIYIKSSSYTLNHDVNSKPMYTSTTNLSSHPTSVSSYLPASGKDIVLHSSDGIHEGTQISNL